MQMQASVLRRKITFWQNHGILHEEENDVFELMEDQKKSAKDAVVMIEDEEESVTASSQDMKEEELQVFIYGWIFSIHISKFPYFPYSYIYSEVVRLKSLHTNIKL